jgi:hypothetical protein
MIFSIATTKGGQCMAFPDVCKTPSPGGPVPIPYPNIAMLNNAKGNTVTKKVKIKNKKVITKKSVIKNSTGDEAGTAKGVVSQKTRGEAKFLRASTTAKAEGQPVVFQTCMVGQNGNNANIPLGVLVTVIQQTAKVMR